MKITVTMRDRVNKAQPLCPPAEFKFSETIPRKEGFYVVSDHGRETIVKLAQGEVHFIGLRHGTDAGETDFLWGPRIEVTP